MSLTAILTTGNAARLLAAAPACIRILAAELNCLCSAKSSTEGDRGILLRHLEIAAADQQVNLPAFHTLQVLQRAVDVVQLAMAATLNGYLCGPMQSAC